MPDQAQVGAEGPANMIALRPLAAHHAALNPTKLRDIAVIGLNRPCLAGGRRPQIHRHLEITRRPVFRATVWGVDPEHQNKAIAFEVNAASRIANVTIRQLPISRTVRIHQPVCLQRGLPVPSEGSHVFEVRQSTVPAIKTDETRGEPAFHRGLEHRTKMVILGQPIIGRIKQAIIAWDGVCVVTPDEADQVDAGHRLAVFARPVPMHQGDLVRIRFIQGAIVDDQQPTGAIHERFGFQPQRQRVRFEPIQQPIQRIVGGRRGPLRLHPCPLGTRDHPGRSEQEVDVVEIRHLGFIHRLILPQVRPTA